MEKRNTILKAFLVFVVVMVLATGAFLVTAFASKNDDKGKTATALNQVITKEQAVSIASAVAKGEVSEVELEVENGRTVYAVEFNEGNTETDVKVDAATGNILKVEQENELGRKELQVISPKISEAQAKSIASKAVKGKVTGIEAKKVNGMYVYEVEIQNNGEETDVLVNMMTGKIEGLEKEAIGKDDEDEKEDDEEGLDEDELSQEEISNLKASITEEQAIKIALNRVDGDVTDVEIERKNGREVYAVEIDDDGDEVDVFVDIKTGEIVGTERDSEEDEEDED